MTVGDGVCEYVSMFVEDSIIQCEYPSKTSATAEGTTDIVVLMNCGGQVSVGNLSVSYVDDSGARTTTLEIILWGNESVLSVPESVEEVQRVVVQLLSSDGIVGMTPSAVLVTPLEDVMPGVVTNISVKDDSLTGVRTADTVQEVARSCIYVCV